MPRRRLAALVLALVPLAACASSGESTAPAAGSGRLAHTVVLWLVPTADAAGLAAELIEVAADFPGVESVHVGHPRATDRPVADASFGVMLSMIFESEAAERAWQEDEGHRRLVESFQDRVERIVVYDALE